MDQARKIVSGLLASAGIMLLAALGVWMWTRSGAKAVAPEGVNAAGPVVWPTQTEGTAAASAPKEADSVAGEPAVNRETTRSAAAPSRPGERAVLAAAHARRSGWSFQVYKHTADWKEVTLFGGPVPQQMTAALSFRWDGKRYVLVREGPIPGEAPKTTAAPTGDRRLTEEDLAGIPEEMRPSEEVALTAALLDYEDWVGKVKSHSPDWAQAVVLIGPPNSEFIYEVHLKWNIKGGYYDVTAQKAIPGPE